MKLRIYQARAIKDVCKSRDNILVVSPAGSGKTVMMCSVVKLLNVKTLIMVSRSELRSQILNTLNKYEISTDSITVSSSVKELNKVKSNKSIDYELVIIDESHHSMSDTHLKVIDHLNDKNDVRVIGFTATPTRAMGKFDFTSVFDRLIDVVSIQDLITKGYLAKTELIHINNVIDYKKLVKTSTDYTDESLTESMILENAVKTYEEYCAGFHKTLIYCPNVRTANTLHSVLRERGYSGYCITGDTHKDERAKVYTDFEYVCNVDVFTEGTDLPSVDTCLILRTTRSTSLYIQFAMRCMRPYKDKQARIIDCTDNAFRLGSPLMTRQWSLIGNADEEEEEKKHKANTSNCKMCGCLNTFNKDGKCSICGAQKYYCDNMVECHTIQDTSKPSRCQCGSMLFDNYDESHESAAKRAINKTTSRNNAIANKVKNFTVEDVDRKFDEQISRVNPFTASFKIYAYIKSNSDLVSQYCKTGKYAKVLKWAVNKKKRKVK